MVVYCDFIAGSFAGRPLDLKGFFRWILCLEYFFFFEGACGTIVGHPFDTIKIWQQFGNRRIRHSVKEIIMRNNGVS